MITDRLIEGIIKTQNPTCVGLDTLFDYLPDEMKEGVTTFEGVAEKVLAFNKKIIDYIYDIVPSVKVQIAYYEIYGVAGMQAYYCRCKAQRHRFDGVLLCQSLFGGKSSKRRKPARLPFRFCNGKRIFGFGWNSSFRGRM